MYDPFDGDLLIYNDEDQRRKRTIGPDVAQINQGESDMGALVSAGLLADLTPYAEQHGWFDKFSQGLVARNSFTPDGEQFGEGNFYGLL